MGYTTAAHTKLVNAGFIDLFEDQRAQWVQLGRQAYAFAREIYADPYRDDVSQHLALALEVNADFVDFKTAHGARAKYWFQYFADLIVEFAWAEIQVQPEEA